MNWNGLRTVLVMLGAVLIVLYLLLERPGDLANSSSLAMFIGAEVVFVALMKYRKAFLPLLLLIFLLAGSDVVARGAFIEGRWVVLAIAAVAGIGVYFKNRNHKFGFFHLIALFCVFSALVSALVSQYPSEAELKTLSLALLFIYIAGGARAAVPEGDPARFFRGILIACEILTWFTALAYFVLHWRVYGNPNSLGAIMGVAVVPVLFWGFMTAEQVPRRTRLGIALAFSTLLLVSTFARAGIAAAFIVCGLLCLVLRQYRFMVKISAAALLIAACAVAIVPRLSGSPDIARSDSLGMAYLYKGKEEVGVFGSRHTVWQETLASMQKNPWFGTGFGTSAISEDLSNRESGAHVDSWVEREHGNSYLEIAEWTGVLGVLPFLVLIFVLAAKVYHLFSWLRRTGDRFSPAVPAAMIVAAGLLHALFEDWMFAVGYYLCVFFWAIASILVDILPQTRYLSPDEFVPAEKTYDQAVHAYQLDNDLARMRRLSPYY